MTETELRQLDAEDLHSLEVLVAEKVMGLIPCNGWKHVNFGSAGGAALIKECSHEEDRCYPTSRFSNMSGSYDGVPPYSRDISAAMKVIERMRQSQEWCCIDIHSDHNYIWRVSFTRSFTEGIDTHEPVASFAGKSLPEAICRAALAALKAIENERN